MPPPSINSAKISGEFSLGQAFERKLPARRKVSGERLAVGADGEPAHSFVHELEPSDSERVTEVPESDELHAPPELRSDPGLETIPAPAPADEED